MHELSVCLSLLDEVKRVARENNAGSVTRIVVKIGPLSGVEPDLLRNAYPIAAAGTIAEEAELGNRSDQHRRHLRSVRQRISGYGEQAALCSLR